MSRNKSPRRWNPVRGMQRNISRLFPKNSSWWQQQFLFHQKLNRKLKGEGIKKSLERITTSNVAEISGVLPENEIKNIYCFLKMGVKNPISCGFIATAESWWQSPGMDVAGTEVCWKDPWKFLGAIRCQQGCSDPWGKQISTGTPIFPPWGRAGVFRVTVTQRNVSPRLASQNRQGQRPQDGIWK